MLDSIWQYLLHQAHNNQFFSGAALAGVVLTGLHYLRGGAVRALGALARRLTVSATVHSEDELYVPLAQWLNIHRFDRLARRYRIRMPVDYNDERSYRLPRELDDAVFGPDYGAYLFRYGGKWLRVAVTQEGEGGAQNTSQSAQTREFLSISYIGLSRALLNDIVGQALSIAEEKRSKHLPCMQASLYGWSNTGTLPRATPACPIVLDGDLLADIEADLERFLASQDWYAQRGIPWRRGYLLHGPPGTGKTSLCRHLARRFDMGIYMVDSAGYMNEQLGTMLKNVRPRSLVLFEDIDCHDVAQRRPDATGPAPLGGNKKDDDPLSLMRMNIGTLLNAIDGINPPEQLLMVMTSNNPDQLDPALVRPGRVDRRIYLGHCSPDQAARLLIKFYPDALARDVEAFRAAVPGDTYTPAELQERFITAGSVDGVLASFKMQEARRA